MARTNQNGDWISPRGKAVPPDYIDPHVKKRDKTVEMIVKRAERLEARMRKDKEWMIRKLIEFNDHLNKSTGTIRNPKGNLQLTNFSGDAQVEFRINDVIDFDERLESAKEILYKCIEAWSADAHQNIRLILDQAFGVGKKQIDKMAILGLRQIKIKDADWQRAMDLITESIQIRGTRAYLSIRTGDDLRRLDLNFSTISVDAAQEMAAAS